MKKLLFILALLLLCGSLSRAACPGTGLAAGMTNCRFVDYSTGSDSNDGLSEAAGHPWKHAPGMNSTAGGDACSATCAAFTPSAGTAIIMKGGVTWPSTAMQWLWNWSGTSTTSGAYGCAGTGCVMVTVDPTWNLGTVNEVLLQRDLGGCTSAPTVAFSGGGGTGAAATAALVPSAATFNGNGAVSPVKINGFVATVTVTSGGSGYTSNPSVTITGGGCTSVVAVAEITDPIIDLGLTTPYAWNFGSANFAPVQVQTNRSFIVLDSLNIRNMNVQTSTISGGLAAMLGTYNSNHVTFSNNSLHNYNQNGTTSGQQEGFDNLAVLVNGQADTYEVAGNYINNMEQLYLSNGTNNAWFAGATPLAVNTPVTFGSGGINNNSGLAYVHGNFVYGVRWLMRGGGRVSQNEWWAGLFSCCGAHGNGFYSIPGNNTTVTADNNVLHDLSPGMSAFYLTQQSGTTYNIYNNVIWNIGSSTPPIGYDGTLAPGSTPSVLKVINNTMFSLSGTQSCVNNNGGTFAANATFILQNNHCITTQGSAHWFVVSGGTVVQNQAGSTVSANIDAANTIMTPAAAVTANYATAFASGLISTSSILQNATGATHTFASGGTSFDYTAACSGVFNLLCLTFSGPNQPLASAARPANAGTSDWDSGAFGQASGGSPAAGTPTCSPAGGSFSSVQSALCSVAGGAPVICYTTNGTTPVTNGTSGCTTGTLYTGAISIGVTTTLKLIAGGTSFTDGPVQTYNFTITLPTTNVIQMGVSTVKGITVQP